MVSQVLYLVVLVGFFALLGVTLWRMAGAPGNEGPAIGHNLPPEAEIGSLGLSRLGGAPALGTPESLVDEDSRPGSPHPTRLHASSVPDPSPRARRYRKARSA
jgi:hypothetical protein